MDVSHRAAQPVIFHGTQGNDGKGGTFGIGREKAPQETTLTTDAPTQTDTNQTEVQPTEIEGPLPPSPEAFALAERIKGVLEENSALDIISIDARGRSSVADVMLIASGRSSRHVAALADYVRQDIKESGMAVSIEGAEKADWILIDAGDVVLHIFRPEVRVFYNLEKIWSLPLPESLQNVAEAAPDD